VLEDFDGGYIGKSHEIVRKFLNIGFGNCFEDEFFDVGFDDGACLELFQTVFVDPVVLGDLGSCASNVGVYARVDRDDRGTAAPVSCM
jgi:hypothetical protein